MNDSEPKQLQNAVRTFSDKLAEAIGGRLDAALIYGSIAKGDFDASSSDHNVALILREDDALTLRAIAKTLRESKPSARTNLLIMTSEELDRARDVFPLKIRDLSRHHILVRGREVLDGLQFEREHLALDCEHQLRSLCIRLRRLVIRAERDPEQLRQNVVASFKGFLPPMAGLVELLGHEPPVTKEEIIHATKDVLDQNPEALVELMRWVKGKPKKKLPAHVNTTINQYIKILKVAALKADALT